MWQQRRAHEAAEGGAASAEWLVALEATAEPGGLDVGALARHLGALGECRPAAGSDRYVVVLRQPGEDPLDALRSAVARFEEAAATIGRAGAHLVGARLVSGKEARTARAETAAAELAPGAALRRAPSADWWRSPTLTWAAAIVLALAVVISLIVWKANHEPARPSLVGHGQLAAVDPHNLLPDGLFETAAGAPRGAQGWGSARFSLVNTSGGAWHEQVLVLPGTTGGVYMEAPAEPGLLYTQSLLLHVVALEPDKRVEVVVEWYDAGHHLVGYHILGVPGPDRQLVRRTQTVRAPSGTAVARLLVNATGGATYVLDQADFFVAPPGAKPTPS